MGYELAEINVLCRDYSNFRMITCIIRRQKKMILIIYCKQLCPFIRKSSLLLLSLILIFTAKCFSQELASHIFHLDSIPAQRGIILNKGWKFHAGDNPQWAKVEYND